MKFYIGYLNKDGAKVYTVAFLELLLANGLFDLYNDICALAEVDGEHQHFRSIDILSRVDLWDALFSLFGAADAQVEIGGVGYRGTLKMGELMGNDSPAEAAVNWVTREVLPKMTTAVRQASLIIHPKYEAKPGKSQETAVPVQVVSAEEQERLAREIAAKEEAKVSAAAEKKRREEEEEMARKKKADKDLEEVELPKLPVSATAKVGARKKSKTVRPSKLSGDKITPHSADDVLADILNGVEIPETAAKVISTKAGSKMVNTTALAWQSNLSLLHSSTQSLIQKFVEELYPSTEGEHSIDKALNRAVTIIEELVCSDPSFVITKTDGYAFKSILDSDSKFTFQISTLNGSSWVRKNISASINFSADAAAPVSFTNVTVDGKKDAMNISIAEKLSRHFIIGISSGETLMKTLLSVMSGPIHKDAKEFLGSYSELMSSALKWNAQGELTELPLPFEVEDNKEITSILDGLLSFMTLVRGGGDGLVNKVYTSIYSGKDEDNIRIQTALAAEFITAVLLRIYPIVSALIVKLLTGAFSSIIMSSFEGDKQLQDLHISHSISSEGPHLVYSVSSDGVQCTSAVPLAMLAEECTSSSRLTALRTEMKRKSRKICELSLCPVSEKVSFPGSGKNIFAIFDTGSAQRSNVYANFEAIESRKAVESAYVDTLNKLCANYYVITHRLPLSPDDITAELLIPGKSTAKATYRSGMYVQGDYKSKSRLLGSAGFDDLKDSDTTAQLAKAMATKPEPPQYLAYECEMARYTPVARDATQTLAVGEGSAINVGRSMYGCINSDKIQSGLSVSKTQILNMETDEGKYPHMIRLTPAQLSQRKDRYSGMDIRVALHKEVGSGEQFFKELSTKELVAILNGDATFSELTVEGRLPWHDLAEVEKMRRDPALRGGQSQNAMLLAVVKPEWTYLSISLNSPEDYLEAVWVRMCASLISLSDVGKTKAKAAKAYEEVNYIANEYSQQHKSKRESALKTAKKQIMDDLKRRRDDYHTAFRQGMKKLKSTRHELIQFKAADGMTAEETQLRDLVDRGQLEGFRFRDGLILVKTPEISIYESFLIYKIGKFMVKVAGFSDNKAFGIAMYNLTMPKTRGGGDLNDHPHVRNGQGCLGNLNNMLSEAVTNQDLPTIVTLVKSYLGTVNIDDGYGRTMFDNWQGALPTIHNIIKFGVVGNMDKGKGIVLMDQDTGKVVTKTMGKIKYDDIVAEYERVKKQVYDLSSKGSDIPYSLFATDPSNVGLGQTISPRAKFNGTIDAITTQRTDAQIKTSIEDFENTIRSREHWNKYIRRIGVRKAKAADTGSEVEEEVEL